MTLATTFSALLIDGFAQLLADADAQFAWQPADAYSPSDTGIGRMAFPAQCKRAVAVGIYPLSADPTLSQSLIGVQFMSRSPSQDPRDVMSMDDSIQSTFLGLFPITLPTGLRVSSLVWNNGGSLGRDAQDIGWLWASSFHANVNRQSAHRS